MRSPAESVMGLHCRWKVLPTESVQSHSTARSCSMASMGGQLLQWFSEHCRASWQILFLGEPKYFRK